MVRTSALLSRSFYWLGVLVTLAAIAVVLLGARQPSLGQIAIGFVLGLLGILLTARGATMRR